MVAPLPTEFTGRPYLSSAQINTPINVEFQKVTQMLAEHFSREETRLSAVAYL
jgi:hypothetical protein